MQNLLGFGSPDRSKILEIGYSEINKNGSFGDFGLDFWSWIFGGEVFRSRRFYLFIFLS